MADVKALAEELVNLTVKDVQELAKVLKEEYGIEPAAAAVAVAGPAAAAEAAPAEQTEFDVILTSAGQAKLLINILYCVLYRREIKCRGKDQRGQLAILVGQCSL